LLDSNLGRTIDKFDNVLRFHEQFPYIKEYQKDIGKKTTILAGNGNARSLHRLKKLLSKQQRMSDKFMSEIQEVVFAVKQSSKKQSPRSVIIRSILQQVADLGWPVSIWGNLSIPKEYHNRGGDPTSGMVILYNLINEYDKIYLCGFNLLVGKNTDAHFYDSVKMKPCHDLANESKIIQKMARKTKKIKLLRRSC